MTTNNNDLVSEDASSDEFQICYFVDDRPYSGLLEDE